MLAAALLVAASLAASVAPVVAEETTAPVEEFTWPTTGRVTQNYGCTGFWAEPRRGSCAHFHGGIDIANSRGTPIRAAADGVVSHVGWDPWLPRRIASWMVIINHGDGLQTMYAHLRDREMSGIQRGARVSQGQVIGLMDTTGMSTGPHLHFSFLRNGSWVSPRNFISGNPERRRPQGSTVVQATCFNFGAGMGAYNGELIAMPLEFDGPRTCAA